MDNEFRKKALDFATKWHRGQTRKGNGEDYINHPIAVAEIAQQLYKQAIQDFGYESQYEPYYQDIFDNLYVVSLLHDVVEDTGATNEDLQKEFGYYVASVVDLLTRKKDQTYFDFIMRLVKEYDFLPIYVKMADLKHNMSDLSEGSMKDKYRLAYHVLKEVLDEAKQNITH